MTTALDPIACDSSGTGSPPDARRRGPILRAARRGCVTLLLGLALAAPAALAAPFAYITNGNDNTVSVIDLATNGVVGSPIPVGPLPLGVAATPNGRFVYVANGGGNTVSVIDTATKAVANVEVGARPYGVAVTPDGKQVYVTNVDSDTVSVIDAASNVVSTVPLPFGSDPVGVAVTPDGKRVYVANYSGNTVSVISTETNTVVGDPIAVGTNPYGVAVKPDGTVVYVSNQSGFSVSAIDTTTHAVTTVRVSNFIIVEGIAVTPDGKFLYLANGPNVLVIDAATLTVTAVVSVGQHNLGLDVTLDGKRVYVADDSFNNTVNVIDTTTNTVVATVAVGNHPVAFGKFITAGTEPFPFTGFFAPVENLPTPNAMKAGAAVPVKFSLGGDRGLDIFAPGYPQAQPNGCPGGLGDPVEQTVSDVRSSLKYDAATQVYTFVWKTDKAFANTCRLLTVRLKDGSDHQALFQFK